MKRTRIIAASPTRSASATWVRIEALIAETLEPASAIDDADVQAAVEAARPVGRLLVAGGHLDREPVVLVAGPVHLTILTVSGDGALAQVEPASVPGAALATSWMLYLPSPAPLTDSVAAIAANHVNLSTGEPLEEELAPAAASIDRAALARRLDS